MADGLGAQCGWGPITPTGSPLGVTYLTKAWQVTEMSSAACYIHLALHVVTICRFVSKPPNNIFLNAIKEMLYGLCCLQTNLCISLHHQSDALLHESTTCEELILSSEIRNTLGKSLQKVHLSSVQPDQKDNHMSWCSTTLCHQIPVLGDTSDKKSAWPTDWWHVMLTCSSTTLDY